MGFFSTIKNRFANSARMVELDLREREAALEKQQQEQELRTEKLRFARKQVAMLSRAHEGAETDSVRSDNWMASNLSPNDAVEQDIENLFDRAEELYRNDCYAASAINGRVGNVIGDGIGYQSRVVPVRSLITESRAKAINEQKETAFKQWAKAERLPAKQKMLEQCKAIYGESFLIMSDVGRSESPVPLTLQVISPRRVETPPDMQGDKNVRFGIKCNSAGEPVSYFIRKTDPNDSKYFNFEYDEIPADRVCHDFHEAIPGQKRGLPWMTPVMNRLKDIKDFTEAHLISEQAAACFSMFVVTDHDTEGAADDASYGLDATGRRLEEMTPGEIRYLSENQDVRFSDPNRPGGTLEPFIAVHLHGIAAGLRYPYELLVKKYDNSYSGGRLSLIDGHSTFRCWQTDSIDSTWQKVSDRFTDECVIVGAIDVDADEYLQNREIYRQDKWMPRGWAWIAPKDDVKATRDAREGGLTTDTDALALHGQDFEETQQTLLREDLAKLEREAKVERRRIALASELGNEQFGMSDEQLKNTNMEAQHEPVNT